MRVRAKTDSVTSAQLIQPSPSPYPTSTALRSLSSSSSDDSITRKMAAVMSMGSVPFSAPGANLYEAHILSLLSNISHQPSPSYPFPPEQRPAKQPLAPFSGEKSPAQEAIERAIITLGYRLWNAEKDVDGSNGIHFPPGQAPLPTPEWSDGDAEMDSSPEQEVPHHQNIRCPTCTRPVDGLNTSRSVPVGSVFASHPLSSSLSTPPAMATRSHANVNPNAHSILTTSNGASVLTGGPGAAGWSGESGMTAEKELELLKAQVQDIARVCKAVATGDLTQKIIVPVEGQAMTELKEIINSMVDRLKTFAVEVERVSLEVGTEGKLGGQAVVEGVEGTWRDLTAVVNKLAANLTSQVRSIAKVTTVSRPARPS